MKKAIAVFFVVALAACATNGKFQDRLNGLMHEPEVKLITAFGPPQSVYRVDADTKVLTFSDHGQVVLPGANYAAPVTTNTTGYVNNQPFNAQSTTYIEHQAPGTVIALNCTVNITVKYGMAIDWHSSGNHCVSR